MNILMVDDMKTVHTYLKSLIGSEEEWELGHAFSGEEALEMLEKKPDFDLILLDWEMPGMDGIETLECIQAKWPNIPVIMVTSRNNSQDFQTVIEKGSIMNNYHIFLNISNYSFSLSIVILYFL